MQYSEREWEVEQIIERNKLGANIPIPAWYYEKKGVPDELRWFWQAFWELDTCRPHIEGCPGRIPWLAVLQYARYHKVDFDYLWHLIVVLDNEYVGFHAKKRNEELEELKKKSKSGKDKVKGARYGRK